ncbi:hypothetical protein FH972_019620 [Carpinus fangiana]|uniref:NAC domain-containing protein n=1 Tax=Carpinus fangiana TaxID=176857 RepID=A0A5N6RV27_9ROSI|nr:hypothetical protein FH972_019620 [Carpinus fangiana]
MNTPPTTKKKNKNKELEDSNNEDEPSLGPSAPSDGDRKSKNTKTRCSQLPIPAIPVMNTPPTTKKKNKNKELEDSNNEDEPSLGPSAPSDGDRKSKNVDALLSCRELPCERLGLGGTKHKGKELMDPESDNCLSKKKMKITDNLPSETEKWKEALPIGARFYPAEGELIDFYLAPKNMGKSLFPG